jgi:hypothetical protein
MLNTTVEPRTTPGALARRLIGVAPEFESVVVMLG